MGKGHATTTLLFIYFHYLQAWLGKGIVGIEFELSGPSSGNGIYLKYVNIKPGACYSLVEGEREGKIALDAITCKC